MNQGSKNPDATCSSKFVFRYMSVCRLHSCYIVVLTWPDGSKNLSTQILIWSKRMGYSAGLSSCPTRSFTCFCIWAPNFSFWHIKSFSRLLMNLKMEITNDISGLNLKTFWLNLSTYPLSLLLHNVTYYCHGNRFYAIIHIYYNHQYFLCVTVTTVHFLCRCYLTSGVTVTLPW